ncbi:hypothetical protein EON70_00170 [bacterium]|nr:MAG: hypothetical protein EON70_00170 [bacterium]
MCVFFFFYVDDRRRGTMQKRSFCTNYVFGCNVVFVRGLLYILFQLNFFYQAKKKQTFLIA